ncbi:TonB family protein [Marinicella sediminis]|uniref:TonB family protein n=1 Tax=Marinicella sediminis TaxID=1792834 RepID=A0ABV7JJQ0_9GAMM|nr:TonB family protein [Marinicella sediminis]
MYKKMLSTMGLILLVSSGWAQEEEETEASSKRPSWSEGLPERQNTADLNTPDFKPDIDNDIELDMSEFGIKPKADIVIDLPISAELPEDTESVDSEPEAVEPVTVSEPVEVLVDEQPEQAPVEEASPDINDEQEALLPVEEAVVERQPDEPPAIEETDMEASPTQPATGQVAEVVEEIVGDDETDAQLDNVASTEELTVDESLAAVEPPVDTSMDAVSEAQSEESEYVWSIIKQTPVKYPVRAAIENVEGWVDVEVTINADGQVVSANAIKYSRKGRLFGKPAVQAVNEWLFDPPRNQGIEGNLTRVYKIEFNL